MLLSMAALKKSSIPRLEAILKFINEHDCAHLPDGETAIEGRELFVRVSSYLPKPALENRFETHRNYADVQYIAQGAELMQTAHPQDLSALTDYDSQGDCQFFKPQGLVRDLIVRQGDFAVFFPNQAHRPACRCEGYDGPVKKLVFKVKIH